MKKRKISLCVALVFMVAGALLISLGVLGDLGVQPAFLEKLSLSLASALGVVEGHTGSVSAGIFFFFYGTFVLVCRGRKPFSMGLSVLLFPIYLTLVLAARKLSGSSLFWFSPGRLSVVKPALLVLLFVLEILLFISLLAAVRGLDGKWKRKKDIERRMLEKEGLAESREEKEKKRLLSRERKLKEVEDRKRKEEEEKYEKERAKAEEKARRKKEKEERKEKERYEKRREKEEARIEEKERKEKRKEEKEKDRLLEKEEDRKDRERREEEKRKEREEKERREKEEEEKRKEEEELGPPPEYASGLGNPDTPLVFPDFDPMPELKNIVKRHGGTDEDALDAPAPEHSLPHPQSHGIMDSLKTELKREEEAEYVPPKTERPARYRSGGMLEAALESVMDASDDDCSPTRDDLPPIIGFENLSSPSPVVKKDDGGIAPSGLSPDHPRYKLFEALQEKREESVYVPLPEEKGIAPSGLSPDHPRYKLFQSISGKPIEKADAVEERKTENVAPSNLSPDHPRYKYFEALSKKPEAPAAAPERDSDSAAPSNLPPDHSRRKLFEALRNDSKEKNEETSVSYIPSRPFVAEKEEANPSVYSDVTVKTPLLERQVEESVVVETPLPLPPQDGKKNTEDERKIEMIRAINAAAAARKAPQTVEESAEDEEDAAFTAPVNTRLKGVEDNGDGTKTFSIKSEEREEQDFNLAVGVGDLATNRLGYMAIENRQKTFYTAPGPDLLIDYPGVDGEIDEDTYNQGAIIVKALAEQRLSVELSNIIKGPTVTMYELKLAQGTIISKIRAREDEIGYALEGKKIRILAPIPGKQAVGIEVPNSRTATVGFKDMLYALRNNPKYMGYRIPMILGRTVTGDPIVIDVSKMPHMIIAGTTGSGKSVCINSLVNTIIYQKGPKDVRLILVDPKVVELAVYNGIPHLLTEVITEPKRAIKALDWLVSEMERRYAMMARYGVRNITGLNEKIMNGEITGVEKVPFILLVMDEFADFMVQVGKEMDAAIGRIAAKARAAGINMILATQRPSADVVTGTLKSNLPGRIAFAVSSGINSRVILDEQGAENLLGKGDMLLLEPGSTGLQRIQGAFMSDEEVENVSAFVHKNNSQAEYLDESIFEEEEEFDDTGSDEDMEDGDGDIYEAAKKIVFERRQASASYLQRRLKIGYNRAARLVEMMEEDGIVGPANGSKPREVLHFD